MEEKKMKERELKELEELRKKYKELEDYAKRLKAEFENYKSMVSKEKRDIMRNATEYIIEKLLPVLDDFERAFSNLNVDDRNSLMAFVDGIRLIYRKLWNILENEGLVRIEAKGLKFDPFEHEVVEKVESSEHEEFTILEEVEGGYKLHSKVLKPAKVKVSVKPSIPEKKEEKEEKEEGTEKTNRANRGGE